MIKNFTKAKFLTALFINFAVTGFVFGQTYRKDMARNSALSDIRTGGLIEKSEIIKGEKNIKLTVNVPAFQMTLWQNGKEVKSYPIGVGLKDHPIFIGLRDIKTVIWNPVWIPPDSEWVKPALRGKIIKPTDPRNPLGKIKIPLGYGYLIHQAKGTQDLGNMVSHGCVRVLLKDLYDLNDKIVTAYDLEVSPKEISRAKRTKKTFVIELLEKMPLEVTYDPLVVKNGILHIYPDIYDYKKKTIEKLREELKANKVDDSNISDDDLEKMLTRAKAKKQYVISLEKIKKGDYLDGKLLPVVKQKTKKKKRRRRR